LAKRNNVSEAHWINEAPNSGKYQVRVRHRAPLIDCDLSFNEDKVVLRLTNPQRAIAPGQSAVLYDGEVCLGGGIII
jgi:tRNA-specific 2-thiouridylase